MEMVLLPALRATLHGRTCYNTPLLCRGCPEGAREVS
jgi:hypothetical protein